MGVGYLKLVEGKLVCWRGKSYYQRDQIIIGECFDNKLYRYCAHEKIKISLGIQKSEQSIDINFKGYIIEFNKEVFGRES